MLIHKDIDNIKINRPYVTIGTFDGVHLGHQHIFKELIKEARENDGESVVITFWPHPRMIINPEPRKVSMINTIEEKQELIKNIGVQHFIILPFSKEFARLSSKEFIHSYLYKKIGIKGLIVGYDHRFGKDRQGNIKELQNCADRYGFSIRKLSPFSLDEQIVSSTLIRDALFSGEIEKANSYLSRKFTLPGIVSDGKKIGRDLGFPTANIRPESKFKLVPKDGVYAVKVKIDDKLYMGMLNIGTRPTFEDDGEERSIEVHIIEYEGDLYGLEIKLFFYKRIRNELKFSSIEELVSQLKTDKQQILEFFKKQK